MGYRGTLDIASAMCDRCCQRAVSRIDYDRGGRLYFCRHHLNAFYPETGAYEGVTITYATVTV